MHHYSPQPLFPAPSPHCCPSSQSVWSCTDLWCCTHLESKKQHESPVHTPVYPSSHLPPPPNIANKYSNFPWVIAPHGINPGWSIGAERTMDAVLSLCGCSSCWLLLHHLPVMLRLPASAPLHISHLDAAAHPTLQSALLIHATGAP